MKIACTIFVKSPYEYGRDITGSCTNRKKTYPGLSLIKYFFVLSLSALTPSKLERQVLRARFLGSILILPAIRCGNRTQDSWVRSRNASSVLCRPPSSDWDGMAPNDDNETGGVLESGFLEKITAPIGSQIIGVPVSSLISQLSRHARNRQNVQDPVDWTRKFSIILEDAAAAWPSRLDLLLTIFDHGKNSF